MLFDEYNSHHFPLGVSFFNLLQSFHPNSKSTFTVKWLDEDGDAITMSSQVEWSEALSSFKSSPFKLFVYCQESANTPMHQEEEGVKHSVLTSEYFYSSGQDATTVERKSCLQNMVPEIVSQLMVDGELPLWAAEAVRASPSNADTLLDVNISKLANVLHQRAWKLLNDSKANDEEAARLLRFCIALTPDDSVAYFNLACAYSRLYRIQEALETLQESVRLSGDEDKELENIKKDDDLQNLRESELFKEAFPQLCTPPVPCQYAEGLQRLHELGFNDDQVNATLLEEYNGDVSLILQDQLQSCLF